MKGETPWRSITVVGCGLIGASFALALKGLPTPPRVAGWDRSAETLAAALGRGIIDEVDENFAARRPSASELIYLAMPVGGIIEMLRERDRWAGGAAVVTDAGSTKEEICRMAREHLPRESVFIGGHPVAGSHRAGLAHARADLFAGAPYVLTPESEGREVLRLRELLEALGARVRFVSPAEHDVAMAFASHLPQLLASALHATVAARAEGEALAGSGYRDMTRLASSSWAVWRDILATNSGPVAGALDACLEILAGVRDELRGHEPGGELPRAAALFAPPASSSQQT